LGFFRFSIWVCVIGHILGPREGALPTWVGNAEWYKSWYNSGLRLSAAGIRLKP